ncbi:MAG: 50S ribosomal protein L18 [Magnetococcales bacterium]|nr:50S ribosomal protein L18 [Magnetococcales bacterium]NGZ27346.1 50S ribosomal protein L18 [Magnetococcales bacterium]
MAKDAQEARKIRAARVRYKLRQVSSGRLRLSIFRSSKHTYAQVIDDSTGTTLVSASTLEMKELRNGGNIQAAIAVGKKIAEKAIAANITQVVFDRGGYLYHGRTKALADAAREGGLEF